MHCTACGSENPPGTRFCSKCGAVLGGQPVYAPAPQQVAGYAPQGGPAMVAPPPNCQGYAGFWLRAVAYLIDGFVFSPIVLIIFGALFGLVFVTSGVTQLSNPDEVSKLMTGVGLLAYLAAQFLLLLGFWLYFAGMESSRYQGTLGKLALGLKVTDQYGNRVSFGKASGRLFGKIISGFTFGIGYIMIAFTERRQALHDILAGCLVVRK